MTARTTVYAQSMAFGAAIVCFAAVLAPAPADAATWWQRYAGSNCTQELNLTNGYRSSGASVNYSTTVARDFYCPIVDSYRVDHTTTSTLNVHVYDDNTQDYVLAQACVKYYGSSGGGCGTSSDSGGMFTGQATLTPTITGANGVWDDSVGDFAYVYVYAPVRGGSVGSYVNGWYMAGTNGL